MARLKLQIPLWTMAAPVLSWLLFAGAGFASGTIYSILLAAGLIGSVLAAVHHAEVIAHRVGEPYGALVLAVAATSIEVALIISLMLTPGHAAGRTVGPQCSQE